MGVNRLSVIIPVYNAEKTIRDTLDSIISQDVADMELLCINDGSTDSSLGILQEYREKHPELRICSVPNGGPGKARNKGIELATGEYLCFCDADDLMAEDALRTMLRLAESRETDVVVCRALERLEDGSETAEQAEEEPEKPAFRFFSRFNCYARLYRTAFLRTSGVVFPSASHAEDRLFLARLYAKRPRMLFSEEVVYYYCRRSGSGSLTSDRSKEAFLERVRGWIEYRDIMCKLGPDEKHIVSASSSYLVDQWKRLSSVEERRECFGALQSFFLDASLEPGVVKYVTGLTKKRFVKCRDYDEYIQNMILTYAREDAFFTEKPIFAREKPTQPAISIIMPVYNSDQYLVNCLLSLVVQRFRDFEVICVDDGSTDTSPFIMDAFCGLDARFVRVAGNRKGAGAARNIGLEYAAGKYLLFLDSDDFFCPDMLLDAFTCMEQKELDLCIWASFSFDNERREVVKNTDLIPELFPKDRVFAGVDSRYIFNATSGAPWNKMYRASYFLAQNVRYMEQACFNDLYAVRVLLAKAKRIYVIPKPEMYYRINNPKSLQGQIDKYVEHAFHAYDATQKRLEQDGLWDHENIRISFLNSFLSGSVYILSMCRGFSSFEKAFRIIRESPLLKQLDAAHVHDHLRPRYEEYLRIQSESMAEYLFANLGVQKRKEQERQDDLTPFRSIFRQRVIRKSKKLLKKHLSEEAYEKLGAAVREAEKKRSRFCARFRRK